MSREHRDGCRFTFRDLREKEVVCLGNGRRLGYPCDLELDLQSGQILALLLPADRGVFSFSGKAQWRIPFACICCIGEDLILVQGDGSDYGGHRDGDGKG